MPNSRTLLVVSPSRSVTSETERDDEATENESVPKLHIEIDARNFMAAHIDRELNLQIRKAVARFEHRDVPLELLHCERSSLLLESRDLRLTLSGRRMLVPGMVRRRLLDYLKGAEAELAERLGPREFIEFLFNRPPPPPSVEDGAWLPLSLDVKREFVPPGALLLIGRTKRGSGDACSTEAVHFAVSVGYGLYLSKFGSLGGVLISELWALMEGFRANTVVVAAPRPEGDLSH